MPARARARPLQLMTEATSMSSTITSCSQRTKAQLVPASWQDGWETRLTKTRLQASQCRSSWVVRGWLRAWTSFDSVVFLNPVRMFTFWHCPTLREESPLPSFWAFPTRYCACGKNYYKVEIRIVEHIKQFARNDKFCKKHHFWHFDKRWPTCLI